MIPSTLKILVPQGAEYKAVVKGIHQAVASQQPSASPPLDLSQPEMTDAFNPKCPTVIPIPVGPAPVKAFLSLLQIGHHATLPPFQPNDAILLMGLGGSLSPDLDIGAVTLIEHCTAYEFLECGTLSSPMPDTADSSTGSYCDNDADGSPETIAGDRPLLHWLQQCFDAPIPLVHGITSPHIVSTAEEKAQLHQRFHAAIVEMEGYSVLQFCQDYGLRGAVLRVVGDRSDHNIPDLNHAIRPDGTLCTAPLMGGLLRGLLQNPRATAQFISGSLTGLGVLRDTAYHTTIRLIKIGNPQ